MRRAIVLCLALVFIASSAMAGPKWEIGEDAWMKLSFLGQPHFMYQTVDEGDDYADAYLRRGRFILAGQITEGVKFFVETDNDNAGKRKKGSLTAGAQGTDIQDAWVDFKLCDFLSVQGGLILLPFSFIRRDSERSDSA